MQESSNVFRRPAVFASATIQPESVSLLRDPTLALLVTDAMDLRTLVNWRMTCRAGNEHVARALRRTTTRLLFPFLPCTREFLRYLTDHRAVMGGEVALAFVLRDATFEPQILEVCTGMGWFEPFVFGLGHDLSAHLVCEREEDVDLSVAQRRGVKKFAVFATSSGCRVLVYESNTMSPCSPIARSWCSAMMNWVSEDCFGAAYLSLIEQRRSLVSDLASEPFHPDEDETMDHLIEYGFSFSAYPAAWPEFRFPGQPPRGPGEIVYPCMRGRFVCPDQARFFGDGGSAVGLVDSSTRDFDYLHYRSLAPFGHMPVWRLWNSTICSAGCAYADPILPRGVISTTTVYADEGVPFVRQDPDEYEPEDYQDIASYVDVAARGMDEV